MRLLLDTHILIWILNDDPALSEGARSQLTSASQIFVSIASLWEIAIKVSLNKLKNDLIETQHDIEEFNFKILPITQEHILTLSRLARVHGDPFDRMLIAQAMSEPLHLITADKQLAAYSDLVMLV
jgi:PIN domain nuclease of toxin-antitoxin system